MTMLYLNVGNECDEDVVAKYRYCYINRLVINTNIKHATHHKHEVYNSATIQLHSSFVTLCMHIFMLIYKHT